MSTIVVELSVEGINDALKQIEAFKKSLDEKMRKLRERVATRIAWSASEGFSSALVSDVVKGEPEVNDVSVRVEEDGDMTLVIADGEKAVFIEFGAGVYYNGAVGQSPHPWVNGESPNPAIGGFTIGSYGRGNGAKNAWAYYDENGQVTVTRGTPAAMPMYHGLQDALAVIRDLAEEVFRE